jgi:hypothetical protein
MPRGQATRVELPTNVKVEIIEGEGFIKIREAAKLGGVHPVVLEMGQRLLKNPGGAGAAFALATPELQKRADDIAKMFKTGLRRVAPARVLVRVRPARAGTAIVRVLVDWR